MNGIPHFDLVAMLLETEGRLFDFEHQAYAHGVSAKGRMDAGIALEFRQRLPQMAVEYAKACRTGRIQPGDVFTWSSGPTTFLNLVTQTTLARAERRYLAQSIAKMYVMARERGITDIAMPRIGCGRGGLNLEDLKNALHPFFTDSEHHVTIYDWTEGPV